MFIHFGCTVQRCSPLIYRIEMVSLKVISITPNRNLNTPKVIFVTLGILFLFDIFV